MSADNAPADSDAIWIAFGRMFQRLEPQYFTIGNRHMTFYAVRVGNIEFDDMITVILPLPSGRVDDFFKVFFKAVKSARY